MLLRPLKTICKQANHAVAKGQLPCAVAAVRMSSTSTKVFITKVLTVYVLYLIQKALKTLFNIIMIDFILLTIDIC